MLRYNLTDKSIERLQVSELREENILERYDFQPAIVKYWDVVRHDLNLPNSFLIGEEVNPHESVGNSIDLLAFDPGDSSLSVIELKRDRNKLQLLQALSYAAMVATWSKETLISKIQRGINPDPSELVDFINENDLNPDVRIVMVAELYDPEVIITADWLLRNYGVNITAFAISVHKQDSNLLFHFDQRFPLKELADVYDRRGNRTRALIQPATVEWEDVIPKLDYSFAARAVRLFSSIKDGEPTRKRIGGIRKNLDGFNRVDVYFPAKYLRVYVNGTPENAEQVIQSKFSTPIEVTASEAGFYGFNIYTESQFEELLKWLDLQSTVS